jgi:hypothetical protein
MPTEEQLLGVHYSLHLQFEVAIEHLAAVIASPQSTVLYLLLQAGQAFHK